MRTDTSSFAALNNASAKRPRYAISMAFDSANANVWWFTSHSDTATPNGASVIASVIEAISGTSQTLSPDKATASIGSITFQLTDKASVITSQLGSQLALGRSTRRQRVQVYVGYEGLAFADYALVQTQLVGDISYNAGMYTIRCMDIQREMRKEIFNKAKTTLASTLLAGDATINVYNTAPFTMVAHGTSYSDSPSATVGYLKVQDEIIKYTGLTPTSFTGCTRGALNTLAVDHAVDPAANPDRRTAVEEYVYLELPALKAIYALLTGWLYRQQNVVDYNFADGAEIVAPSGIPGTPSVGTVRSGTSTRIDSSGKTVAVSANAARFDYDLARKTPKGILIEPVATNDLFWVNDFTNGVWGTGDAANPKVPNSTDVRDPNGGFTACKWVLNSIAGNRSFGQAANKNAVPGATDTFSFYVWIPSSNSANPFKMYMYAGNSLDIPTDWTELNTIPRDQWVLVKYTHTWNGSAGGAIQAQFHQNAPDTVGDKMYVWWPQLESGPFASSRIATTSASVTRSADVPSVALGAWHNATEFTVIAEFDLLTTTTALGGNPQVVYELSDDTDSERVGFYLGKANVNTFSQYGTDGGSLLADTTAGSGVAGTVYRSAARFKLNDFAVSLDGAPVATDTAVTMPTLTKLYFGSSHGIATRELRGHLKRLVYIPKGMSNTFLQSAANQANDISDLLMDVAVGGGQLPTTWHLGIPKSYVQLSDFISKPDLWKNWDDTQGFITRFEDLDKGDGKKFIEQELALLLGAFMPVYASGALGVRRMANILAGAGYTRQLDESVVVSHTDLKHDFDSLHNQLQVSWNWEPISEDFTRVNLLIDGSSITVHGKSDPLLLEFRGLHGSRHSSVMLAQRFDALRDRYSGPPLRLSVTLVPSCNAIEIGDVVRARLPRVRDFVSNGSLDRSFEVQNTKVDWVHGQVTLDLFASSQAPGALAPTSDATVLSNAWYTGAGTDLSTVLTITGSNPGHISANGAIAGGGDMSAAPSIFYYNGDLQLDSGVTVTLTGNVQLRVKGFFQNNGTLNGKGGGYAGAAAASPSSATASNPGTRGFLGTTEPGGGVFPHKPLTRVFLGIGQTAIDSYRGQVISGVETTVPTFNLSWDGTNLVGVPTDLRGSSGSSGMPLFYNDPDYNAFGFATAAGGAGGASGAGLMIACRGFAQGASAKVDLSGADGLAGGFADTNWGVGGKHRMYAGSGAGGAPGGMLIVIDGAGLSATGLSEVGVVALQGKTPQFPIPLASAGMLYSINGTNSFDSISSYWVGTGDNTTFALPNLSGARGGVRVQYVPNNAPASIQADPGELTLLPPSSLALIAGTTELLTNSDGTITVRIKASWTPSNDARVAGYDIQFKKSSDSIWIAAPSVVSQSASTGWAAGVQDGVNYDVRVRAAGALREVSDWLTITGFFVTGKTAKPSDVGTLTFTDPYLTWAAITDPDRRGYVVKYQPGTSTVWSTALQAHKEGFITPTKFDTSFLVGGQTTLLVKAVDTTGNESTNVASLTVDLRPVEPTTFLISRQPDGTRQFEWTISTPPDDLAGYRIRYFLGSTSDWTAMTALHTGILVSTPFETNLLAAGTYTFAIKTVDRAGNESTNAKFITSVTIGDPRIAGAIGDFKEEPTWTGTKTNCSVDVGTGWLIADNNGTWATLPTTWDAWTQWPDDSYGSITYVRQIDVGIKTKFTPLVTVTGDGAQTIEEQHSDDNISYSSYAAVGPQVDARYIRIRLTMVHAFPKVKTMRIILSAQVIEEFIQDLTTSGLAGAYRIGTGDIRLPITKVYSLIKNVNVTLQSVGAGWSWELIDKDKTVGPRVKIYNAANALADAVIDADISGV